MAILRLYFKDGHVQKFEFTHAPEIFRLPQRSFVGWTSTSFKKREGTLLYDEFKEDSDVDKV